MAFIACFCHIRRCVKKGITIRNYTSRRAILYSPGDDMKKLVKALAIQADCVIMDCEDGVAQNKKDAARRNISTLLNEGPVSKEQPEWSVRVNSVDSGLCQDDLNAILANSHLPPTLHLSKVENPGHIQWFADKVSELLKKRTTKDKINLSMYIESAESIMNLRAICSKAKEIAASSPIESVALVFGSDDLCASLGCARSEDAAEMVYARQKLVLVAKAFHLQAIDMVHIEFKDLEGLRKQSELGARMGFTGKQAIHPAQVPVIQEAFLPSKEQVAWARGLVQAFNEHQKSGKGAFVYKGSMIDMPSLRQAQNILQLAADKR